MHRNAGQTLTAGKWGGLIALGAVILVLGAWPGQAAELPTPKKPRAPAAAAPTPPATKSPPTLRSPQIKTTPESTSPGSRRSGGGQGPSISTTTTREPVPNQEDPEALPCGKRPSLKTPGKVPRTSGPCTDGSESGGESGDESASESESESEPDYEDESLPSSGRGGAADRGSRGGDDAGAYGDEGAEDGGYPEETEGEYGDTSSDEPRSAPDFDELTGKIPGFTPFGGEESGSSESSTVEGGRPWYEKLGKPGGGRPPADDEEE